MNITTATPEEKLRYWQQKLRSTSSALGREIAMFHIKMYVDVIKRREALRR